MRTSVDDTDHGYDIKLSYKVDSVTLNGEVIPYVITADEELGYIKSYCNNSVGDITQESYGVVKINFKEEVNCGIW